MAAVARDRVGCAAGAGRRHAVGPDRGLRRGDPGIGGDHADITLADITLPDITLAEIAERLEREHGERFAPSAVHRFFRRHGLTLKESPATPASRRAPTSPPRATPGQKRNRG